MSELSTKVWPLAFISYSSKDKETARKVASSLRNLGIDVWIDHEQVRFGDSIPNKIATGLSKCDAILLLISEHYIKSSWCRAEYEPLLTQEIESGRTYVIAIRLDDADLPTLLWAKRYVDFRGGFNAEALTELAQNIVEGSSYTRFERLVPNKKTKYHYSILSMIISSTLREFPVPTLENENLLEGKSLIDLFRTIETLIERFQDLCDEIVKALVSDGIQSGEHQSVYGSAYRLGQPQIISSNRKLASIAADMREIASSLNDTLNEDSELRERFTGLLQICATISVAEDFLIVKFGAPLNIPPQMDENSRQRGLATSELIGLDRHDSWDNSQKLEEYARILSELDSYKVQLRRSIAKLSLPHD